MYLFFRIIHLIIELIESLDLVYLNSNTITICMLLITSIGTVLKISICSKKIL